MTYRQQANDGQALRKGVAGWCKARSHAGKESLPSSLSFISVYPGSP